MTPEQITLMGKVREVVEKNPGRHDQSTYIGAGVDKDGDCIPIGYEGLDVEELRNYALLPIPEVSEKDSNICKTTGCVAGWASALAAPKGSKLNDMGVLLPGKRSYNSISYSAYGQEALGISDGVATWLFAPSRSREEILWALEWLPTHDAGTWAEIESASYEA